MTLDLAEEDYLSEFAPIDERMLVPPEEGPILPCERTVSGEEAGAGADEDYDLDDPDFAVFQEGAEDGGQGKGEGEGGPGATTAKATAKI